MDDLKQLALRASHSGEIALASLRCLRICKIATPTLNSPIIPSASSVTVKGTYRLRPCVSTGSLQKEMFMLMSLIDTDEKKTASCESEVGAAFS